MKKRFSRRRIIGFQPTYTNYGVLFSVPLFQSVMDGEKHSTESWEKREIAPVPHAEFNAHAELNGQLVLNSVDEILQVLANIQIEAK